jgi:hypothetical protein
MPIGHVVILGWVAASTALSLIRPRRFRRAAYLLVVVVNEVPQLAALYLVLVTALSWAEGDLSGAVGAVLVIATVVTLAGLLEVGRRALVSAAVVDSALRRSGIGPANGPHRLRALLAPFPFRPRGVIRVRDIHYGRHRRQRLDLYRRRHGPTGGPVLVYLHGGGYFSGGKHRESRALLHHLAGKGWVCISTTYRLRPQAGFTDHLDDARAALAWAHDNAAGHGATSAPS